MKTIKSLKLSPIAFKILTYGLYSVLCHGILVLFSVVSSDITNGRALQVTFAPMLEYTVMSLTLTLAGGLVAEAVCRDLKSKR